MEILSKDSLDYKIRFLEKLGFSDPKEIIKKYGAHVDRFIHEPSHDFYVSMADLAYLQYCPCEPHEFSELMQKSYFPKKARKRCG